MGTELGNVSIASAHRGPVDFGLPLPHSTTTKCIFSDEKIRH